MDIEIISLPGAGNCNIPLNNWLFHLGDIQPLRDRLWHFSYKAGGWLGNPFEVSEALSEKYEWNQITVPHDWMTGVPIDENANHENGFKPRGDAWYYTSFDLPEDEIEDAFLVFEGVMGQTNVYVNGILAGRNFSGYNKFSLDVADYLVPGGKNEIGVYVDGRQWEMYKYEGAGIYRPARLIFRGKTHIVSDKCFIRGEKPEGKWCVKADLCVTESDGVKIHAVLKDDNDNVVASTKSDSLSLKMPIDNPKLWSPENPYLYTAVYEVYRDGILLDSITSSVGFRTVEWDPDRGMLLNGKLYRIKGICCHQDHAGVGIAMTDEILEYRLRILKEMGANAYRCAHYDQGERLLEMCDRMGFLIMAENRHLSASEEVLGQLEALVCTSRNHPSVFMYSLYNEETWHRENRGVRIARKMKDKVYSLDNTRAVTGALDGGTLNDHNTASVLNVIGMNYFIREYDETHKRFPDKVIIGSENCPTFATRGEYVTDKEVPVYASYGDDFPGFSESINETMEAMDSIPYVGGCFAWGGFGYRGEPNPHKWPSSLCHWGFNDYCGFPKDIAYLLKAWYCDEPVVHLFPHWNWKKGDSVRVCTFTNGDKAELFLNGKSLGIKDVVGKKADWNVSFEIGELEVVVTFGDKKISDRVMTAGDVSGLHLEDVTPYDSDLHIINVSAVDSKGVVVPHFDKTVCFCSDDGEIIGVGNGDPNSHHLDSDNNIKLFHGYAQVIMRGKSLTAKCEGLPDAKLL